MMYIQSVPTVDAGRNVMEVFLDIIARIKHLAPARSTFWKLTHRRRRLITNMFIIFFLSANDITMILMKTHRRKERTQVNV